MDNPVTITARFVGGPWHNRVEEVTCAPKIIVRKAPSLWSWSTGIGPQDHEYFLAEFQTEFFDTTYYQYIYKPLLKDNYAHPCTYREDFKQWRISPREIERRLSEVISKYREN